MAGGLPRGRPGPMPLEPNPIVARLRAYDPGHDLPSLRLRHGPALAELGSNENPYGPSPRVLQALRTLAAEEVYRYPDPQGLGLRRALAAQLGVEPAEICLGNGSHELLMLLAQCFAAPGDEVVHSEFGFAVFAIATAAVGATPRIVPALPAGHPQRRGHEQYRHQSHLLLSLTGARRLSQECFGQAGLDASPVGIRLQRLRQQSFQPRVQRHDLQLPGLGPYLLNDCAAESDAHQRG